MNYDGELLECFFFFFLNKDGEERLKIIEDALTIAAFSSVG